MHNTSPVAPAAQTNGFYPAFLAAIRSVGLEHFKQCSMFISNHES